MNMNRLRYLPFVIAMVLLHSCTLMMDDFDLPEEERGKKEPYTEVLPIGSVTYKYDEKTTPLNGRAQDYIAMYNDSVVYLMDNIPSEWIPKVGGYVAANTTRKTPLGINGRVTSVTRENGLIRVDHVPATRDEVFDVFKAEFDFSFTMPPMEEYDSLQNNENVMMLNDSTYVDMTFFDRITADTVTRADKMSSETFSWNISHKFNEFYGDLEWLNGTYVELEYKSTEHKTIHYYENKDEGKREEWNDSYSEQTYRALFGYGSDAKSAREHYNKKSVSPLGMKEMQQLLKTGKTAEERLRSEVWKEFSNKKKMPRKVIFITTGTALIFTIDYDFDIYFEATGYLDLSYTVTTPKRRVGYEIKDGNKKPFDYEIASGSRTFKANMTGKLDFYGKVRGGVGAGIAGFIGGGIVVGIEAKAGIRGEFDILNHEKNTSDYGSVTYIDNGNSRLVPYLSLGGYAKGQVYVLGIPFDIGDISFLTQTKEWPVSLENALANHTATYKYVRNENTGKKYLQIHSTYSFDQMHEKKIAGIDSELSDRMIGINVYAGDYSGECRSALVDLSEYRRHYSYPITLNTEGNPLPDVDEYKVVPIIFDKRQGITVEYRSKARTLGNAKPKITDTKYTPWYAQEMSEGDFEELLKTYPYLKYYKHTDFSEYAFMTQVKLSNVLRIAKWGINYKIYYDNNLSKTIVDKDVYINDGNDKPDAGKYSVITTFFTNHKPANDGDLLGVFICPFYEYYEDGELKRVNCSSKGPYAMQYPYMGDIKISGITKEIKLN